MQTVTPGMLRSFGRRNGRKMTAHRHSLLQELLPAISVALPREEGGIIPLQTLLAGREKLWLEIGYGGGEHLAAQAEQHPEVTFIGCEPFLNGVSTLLATVEEKELRNIRLFTDDARHLIARLPEGALDRVFILFPDPWPKLRHHKRRIVSAPTLALLARAIRPGGLLRLASDHADYVAWMLEHLLASPDFRWTAECADDWRRPPADWVPTRYETKTRAEGRRPTYLEFRRV